MKRIMRAKHRRKTPPLTWLGRSLRRMILPGVQRCGAMLCGLGLLGGLVLDPTDLLAASRAIDRFSLEEGLSQSEMTCLHLDQEGFLWVGTQDGLNRYDGYEFRVYKHDPIRGAGLPGNYISKVVEDADHHLWVLTHETGLARYDRQGDTFLRIIPGESDGSRLHSATIIGLQVNRSGEVLLSFADGAIQRHEPSGDAFEFLRHPAGVPFDAMKMSYDPGVLHDASGGYWQLGPDSSVFQLPAGASEWLERSVRHSPAGNESGAAANLQRIREDDFGRIRVFGTVGTFVYSPTLERFEPEVMLERTGSGPTSGISDAIALSERRVLLAGSPGLIELDPVSGTQRPWTVPPVRDGDKVHSSAAVRLFRTRDGTVWMGGRDGTLFEVRLDAERLILRYGPGIPGARPSGGPVSRLVEDRAGNLWLGLSGGLYRFRRSNLQFSLIQHDPQDAESLSQSGVWRIVEDPEGIVWVATGDGVLNRVEPGGKITRISFTEKAVPQHGITALTLDTSGRLWLFHREKGLLWLDRQTLTASTPSLQVATEGWRGTPEKTDGEVGAPGALAGSSSGELADAPGIRAGDPELLPLEHSGVSYVFDLFEARDQSMYVLTSSGMLRLARGEMVLRAVTGLERPGEDARGNVFIDVSEGPDGSLWLVGIEKLTRLQPVTGAVRHFVHDPEEPGSLPTQRPVALHLDRAGVVWVGTYGGGLLRLDPETGLVDQVTDRDGLPNNMIYALEEDANGNIWVSTNVGLASYEPGTGRVRTYDSRDGLQSNEFNQYASYRGREGRLYFGGIDGLSVFDPTALRENTHRPPIAITSFRRFDEVTPIQRNAPGNYSVSLSHKDSFFAFEFTALDFTDPAKNHYRYRLEGFEDAWHEASTRRFASYTNLNGGDYRFVVQGSNNSGVWNEQGAVVHLKVVPPLWATWWARCLTTLVAGLSLLTWVRLQSRRLARERRLNAQLRRADRLKDEFLANTSHELRTPLNGIIGLAESLLDGAGGEVSREMRVNLEMIVGSGRRLSHLVNDLLDFSRLRSRDLELQCSAVDLRQITEVVIALTRTLVGSRELIVVNAVPADLARAWGDENRLQQIMYNLIGNAIKFTERGRIKIGAVQHGPWLEVSVEDTGVGIPRDRFDDIFKSFEQVDGSVARRFGGTGLGLAITRQLVQLHGGAIWVDSEQGLGSCFTFRVQAVKGDARDVALIGSPTAQARGEAEQEAVSRCREEVLPSILETRTLGAGSGSFRILVVDDEPVNLQVLANHLALRNYSIVCATSGEEALSIVEKDSAFDLVILDVMMPVMSGFEVCRRLRLNHQPNELPVVMLTACNQIADLVEGFSLGANDYLTKPVSRHELLARTRVHLQLGRISSAYSRFVPREFLQHLELESIVDVKLGDHVLKEMTVVFSDIRAFTSLSETMTPEENFNFLNSYLQQMEPVIREHRGFVDKFIGDAIMALFSRGADDGVRAGVAMLEKLRTYNAGRRRAGYKPLEIGIGINTGRLMLGTVGGHGRMDGTVISDAVNLASRVEGLTKLYGAPLLITEQTRSALSSADLFLIRLIDRVQVKGRSEAVAIFEVFDADEAPLRQRKFERLEEWQEALHAWTGGWIELASRRFAQYAHQVPGDAAAQMYVERCQRALADRAAGRSESSAFPETGARGETR